MVHQCSRSIRIKNVLVREMLAEFLGTFTLIIFGNGSVAQTVLSKDTVGDAMSIHWSWAIGVTLGVYIAGGVSGGHLNPAVTVAVACLRKFSWKKVPFYIISQYLGSFCASALIYFVYMDALDHFDGGTRMVTGPKATAGIWATYPQEYVSIYTCLGDQLLGTGMLLIAVLAVTDVRNMETTKGFQPFAIGLIVFVIGNTYHLNCGYAINPARDLAPRIFTCIAGWGTEVFSHRDYKYFWVPVLGPHLGAILGAFIYQICVGFHWPDIYEVTPEMELSIANEHKSKDTSDHSYENKSMSPEAHND